MKQISSNQKRVGDLEGLVLALVWHFQCYFQPTDRFYIGIFYYGHPDYK